MAYTQTASNRDSNIGFSLFSIVILGLRFGNYCCHAAGLELYSLCTGGGVWNPSPLVRWHSRYPQVALTRRSLSPAQVIRPPLHIRT